MGYPTPSKKPTLQWDNYRRQVLCCLYRFFQLDKHSFASIFSEIFRDHLQERGFGGTDIAFRVLRAQWTWMRRNDSFIWNHVHHLTEFRKDREWKEIVQLIRAKASELEMALEEKDRDSYASAPSDQLQVPTTPTPLRRTDTTLLSATPESTLSDDLPKKSRYWPEHSYVATDGEQEEQEAASTPVPVPINSHRHVFENQELNELSEARELGPCDGKLWGKPCLWCHEEGLVMSIDDLPSLPHSSPLGLEASVSGAPLPGLCTAKDLPPILYRWSNVHSQGINHRTSIVAGLFANPGVIPYPSTELTGHSFLGFFKAHVTKALVKTPFISAFQSPLAPIHRGLRNGEDARLSIIDTSKFNTDVFKAFPLVELTHTALINWKGYGEFLIWHEVPATAIACTFTLSQLEEIASTHWDIGQFLQLSRIRACRHCTRFLYSDLAVNMPESQDNFASTLDKLVTLLEVPANLREFVCQNFLHAWTKKFRDLRYEKPDDRPLSPEDPEYALKLSGSVQDFPGLHHRMSENWPSSFEDPKEAIGLSRATQVFAVMQTLQRERTPSESPYLPSSSDSGDDSSSTSSPESSTEGEEDEKGQARCARHDTPSDEFSVRDDSSEEDWRRTASSDEDEEMPDAVDEWPSDDETTVVVPIHWPANLWRQ